METCPLCHASEGREYIRCADNLVTGELFTVRECLGCGFLFTADEPGKAKIDAYYASDSYEALTGKRSASRSFVRTARQLHMARMIERRVPRGTLLDIGCGAGDFLMLMRKRGWNVSGIEPDEACRTKLSAQGITVLPPATIMTIPDRSADVITLWHVLEHVHDLAAFGMQLKRILKPDGICVIAVPNAQSLDARLYGTYWHGYELPRHLYHFTARSLARFAELSGLHTVFLGSMPLDSLYGCLKSEEYRKGNPVRGLFLAALSIVSSVFRRSSAATILTILKP